MIRGTDVNYSLEDLKILCRVYNICDEWYLGKGDPEVKYPLLALLESLGGDINRFYKEISYRAGFPDKLDHNSGTSEYKSYSHVNTFDLTYYYQFIKGISPAFRDIPLVITRADGFYLDVLRYRLMEGV